MTNSVNARLNFSRSILLALSLGLGLSTWCPAADAAPTVMTPVTSAELKAKLKGKAIQMSVVNLWATWCAPCKTELPDFLKIKKAYEKKGLQLILISADNPDDFKEASLFLDKIGVDFTTFRLGEEPDVFMKAFDPAWSATLPTTMLFDAEGKKLKTWVGAINSKMLEAELNKALKGNKGSKALLATPKKISSIEDLRSDAKRGSSMKKSPVSFDTAVSHPQIPMVKDIDAAELLKKKDAVHVIDVRRPDEYTGELGHIAGSKLIVLDTLPEQINSLPKDEPIVFVCRSGARSAQATALALDSGFQHVYNMKGGMIRWNELGQAVEK